MDLTKFTNLSFKNAPTCSCVDMKDSSCMCLEVTVSILLAGFFFSPVQKTCVLQQTLLAQVAIADQASVIVHSDDRFIIVAFCAIRQVAAVHGFLPRNL